MLPFFELFNSRIYSYPLLMGMAWGAAINLVFYYCAQLKLDIRYFRSLIIVQFLGAWIGAKLLFILTAPKDLPLADNINFWLGGGFVFYGGLILTAVFTFVWIVKGWMNWRQCQIFIPALALGHGIGRIGCFLAGCCFGKHCDLPWAIEMHGDHRHPVQLYESFFLLGLAWWFHRKLLKNDSSLLWPSYFIIYGIFRIMMEFLRADAVRGVSQSGVSTSQIVSIILIGLSVLTLVVQRFQNGKLLRS